MNWIPTKEKLPPSDRWVLYYAPEIFDKGPNMWIGRYDDGAFHSKFGFFGAGEVTHWMFLPDAP